MTAANSLPICSARVAQVSPQLRAICCTDGRFRWQQWVKCCCGKLCFPPPAPFLAGCSGPSVHLHVGTCGLLQRLLSPRCLSHWLLLPDASGTSAAPDCRMATGHSHGTCTSVGLLLPVAWRVPTGATARSGGPHDRARDFHRFYLL